ncbi:unnamed protein product [Tilletia controversa]|nr:unnamed protein product [Tilletia controversa]
MAEPTQYNTYLTGQTFLVTGAGKFTVELVSSNSSPIPHAPAIGEFAGGSGVVQSISKNPPYITVILESVHIGVASQATATEVPQQPQASAWISALQGEANVEPAAVPPTDDVDGAVEITPVNSFCETTGVVQSISKNPPYITVILESVHIGVASQATAAEVPQQPQASAWISALQGEANVEPAAVPPTEDVDGTVEITPVNSFCETTFRFPLFQSEIAPSHWLRVQSKTLT